jgi:hypothetical protein
MVERRARAPSEQLLAFGYEPPDASGQVSVAAQFVELAQLLVELEAHVIEVPG